jgi:hypothetical protein
MKVFIVIFSFLLPFSFDLWLHSHSASAAPMTQRFSDRSLIASVASNCWLTGGLPHGDCSGQWQSCLNTVKSKFGQPEDTGGRPQGNGSQPFYDVCDRARSQCEAKYCR